MVYASSTPSKTLLHAPTKWSKNEIHREVALPGLGLPEALGQSEPLCQLCRARLPRPDTRLRFL